ncbi:glutamyl-tRNA(Gln) amidotransferase subunit D [Thermogymnomonas acidicola]|uniref:Glutamyl-tRNA(Gln) amidotransferase subunit D n=1 Tax=Thermogymnomonas acidicola TaxID=399579 RepID=A0AA37BQ35_9ARCH|nr:Glu-tRNA(Gln) amidotransferase subunit GatD [Thermogymnomonas acidicola]GGM66012.1 glutamyl-tRNA(Gln) amidotransferase subunit D [Thermogymnomonas acidicola]
MKLGDRVEVEFRNRKYDATFVNQEGGIITVKLRSGYNISVPEAECRIRLVQEAPRVEEEGAPGTGNGSVVILTTGGTIASMVDYATGAVRPVKDPRIILRGAPEIAESGEVEVREVMNVFSENMRPADWVRLAREVALEMERGKRVVVAHGTDTMSYTAAALAFMFEGLPSPVVLVGSQRSPDRPSSDAPLNVAAAVKFSSLPIGEVGIAMHGSISDESIVLHRGVRSRKMHTSRRDAFRSIGIPPLASLSHGNVSLEGHARAPSGAVRLNGRLDERVSMVYVHPTLQGSDLEAMADGRRALVLMGTGLGHCSSTLYDSIGRLVRDGVHVVMASQCIGGSVNMNVYSTGRELQSIGVLPAEGMLPEVAYVKSMYVLANYPEERFAEALLTDLRGEVIQREVQL